MIKRVYKRLQKQNQVKSFTLSIVTHSKLVSQHNGYNYLILEATKCSDHSYAREKNPDGTIESIVGHLRKRRGGGG